MELKERLYHHLTQIVRDRHPYFASAGHFYRTFLCATIHPPTARTFKSGSNCEWLPVPYRGLIVPDTRRSDHSPFWDRGYGAIMVTDTANIKNPHYHQESDRIETLNLDFLTGVFQGLEAGIRNL